MTTTLQPVEIKLSTSHTDMVQIGQCQGSWVLRQFNDPEPKPWFERGLEVHEGIETATRDGADPDPVTANWHRWVHPDSPDRLPIFNDYEWPPATEVSFERSAESCGTKYPVRGRIDAIFTSADGGRLIIDWKSGKAKGNDAQLHLYQFGLEAPDALAGFVYVDRSQSRAVFKPASPYPGDAVIRERVLRIERVKEAVIANKRTKFSPGFGCRFCPVKSVCPVRGPDKAQAYTDLTRKLRQLDST